MVKPYFWCLLLILPFNLFAHGMDRPGPHNGHIRMVGTIHTELIWQKSHARVYLLDIGFKNPTVAKSSVKATINSINGDKKIIDCKSEQIYFSCKHNIDSKSVKSIELSVTRQNISPKENAIYEFPLVFQN